MNDAPVSYLLIQASMKTETQLMVFPDYSWQDCPDTVRSTGAYIIFYKCDPIYHGTHVSEIVPQSIAKSEYNAACTARVDLAHFRVLIHELLNKDTDIVP